MGSGIVSNFLKNGYRVFVWNRTKEKLAELENQGAVSVNTPKEAAKRADVVFEVTANDKSSKSVWTGYNGILSGADKSKYFITCATLSTSWIDELASICKKRDLTFFDMPMTGGRVGAETGKLILLIGGVESSISEIGVELKCISQKMVFFERVGFGMRYKLLLNALQAMHIVGFGEILNLASKMGMNLKLAGDALADRPGGTSTNVAWRDYQIEPIPINFSIEWITKDLKYAKLAAQEVDTPILDKVINKYDKALKLKLGGKDWTAINKL